MRLLVRQKGKKVSEFKFKKGPIYIGRQMGCQVFLPEKVISRQHAVIYSQKGGKWIIEDLDSANKTFINKHAIHKIQLKDGDTVNLGTFNIKVTLSDNEEITETKTPIHLDDTVAEINPDTHTEFRVANSRNAPMIKIPPTRTNDILNTCRSLNNVRNLKALHRQLLDIVLSQFAPLNVWIALRRDDQGPMDIEGGRKISSESITLADLMMTEKIKEATEKNRYILVPQMPRCKIRSVIIAPIINGKKCHGVIYANNSTMHGAYDMADLDYLMLIAIQAAAVMELI